MKQLIEDNPFYGKSGTIIGDNVWRNLPDKHKKLFKNNSNNSKSPKYNQSEFDKFMADMRAINPFGEDRPVGRPARVEFNDIPEILNDEFLGPIDLDEDDDEFDEDDE